MIIGVAYRDYYDRYDFKSFFTIKDLQRRISKLYINEELLNAAIFWYTNRERAHLGLPLFKFHNKLREMAILQSVQMRNYDFFDHVNKYESKYQTLSDRMEAFKDSSFKGFLCIAENIADFPAMETGQSFSYYKNKGEIHYFSSEGRELLPLCYSELAKTVVCSWMDSPGHRANIINPDYKFLGCGCAPYVFKNGEISIVYFKLTQNFGGELLPISLLESIRQTSRMIINFPKIVNK